MTKKTHRSIVESDSPLVVTTADELRTAYQRAIPGGFSKLFNRLIDSGAYAQLSVPAQRIYPVLVRLANFDREEQFVFDGSIRSIAKRTGCNLSTAVRGLRDLAAAKLMVKLVDGTGEPGRVSSRFQLLIPQPDPKTEAGGYPKTGSRGDAEAKSHGDFKSASTPDPESASFKAHTKKSHNKVSGILELAGIHEPTRSRLVQTIDEQELMLRVKDWENRRHAGSKLGVAWLIASIQQKYELHETTQAQIDQQSRAQAASANRIKKLEQQAEDDRRQKEIDDQVQTMFDEMSDEELAHWKSIVVEELPSLIRNPERADPRTHERLRRLILGKLAHLVAPSDELKLVSHSNTASFALRK
jgi:hypothetical protein